MTPEHLREVGVGDKLRQKRSKHPFTVMATYAHNSVLVVNQYKQITAVTLPKWSHVDGKSIDGTYIEGGTLGSLQKGIVIIHNATAREFVVTKATQNHAHAFCTVVIRDNEARDWVLSAKAWLRVV
jgi:hypothetical protein